MAHSVLARWIMYLVLSMFSLSSHAVNGVLTFTETSSTVLTVSSTGLPTGTSFSATNTGTDTWRVNITNTSDPIVDGITFGNFVFTPDTNASPWTWQEPGSTDEVNRVVSPSSNVDSFFDVFSDITVNPNDFQGFALDGALQGFGLLSWVESIYNDAGELIRTDTRGRQLDGKFLDTGDGGQVPEPGMLSLIGLSLVALGWSRRRRAQA